MRSLVHQLSSLESVPLQHQPFCLFGCIFNRDRIDSTKYIYLKVCVHVCVSVCVWAGLKMPTAQCEPSLSV